MAQSIADAPETATNHKRLGNIQALLGGVHLRSIRKPALITLGLLLGFVAVFFVYLSVSHIIGSNSDNASIILEGQAMLHGNLLLHGWYLPPDSFITTEMALDALGSVFFSGDNCSKSRLLSSSPQRYLARRISPAATPLVRPGGAGSPSAPALRSSPSRSAPSSTSPCRGRCTSAPSLQACSPGWHTIISPGTSNPGAHGDSSCW